MSVPLTLHTFPRAILHIDGDAFVASCEQSRRPKLQGRPVVTGKERGIAASMSYEAKARGVTRGMRLADIRKLCPDAVFCPPTMKRIVSSPHTSLPLCGAIPRMSKSIV
jgi:DNA polymerase IV